jgi:DNA-binding transcriptional LysR family regulator
MEFRQLRYFVTVARELNFTRAAEKLRVAQPALSRQVRQLEDELGVRLFERDKRHVELTAGGAAFLAEADAILQQSERAMLRARASKGALRLGYVWGLFHTIVPEVLQRFRAAMPDVAISLFDMTATQQGRALAANKLDAGFIGFSFEADSAHLEKGSVGATRFLIALPAGHRLAARPSVSLASLASEVFLRISEEHFPGASQLMTQACRAAGFQPRTLQTPERGHTILGLVSAGCGVALLPETLAALPHSGVIFRPPEKQITAELYLAWRPDIDRDVLRNLQNAVQAPRQSSRKARGRSSEPAAVLCNTAASGQ